MGGRAAKHVSKATLASAVIVKVAAWRTVRIEAGSAGTQRAVREVRIAERAWPPLDYRRF